MVRKSSPTLQVYRKFRMRRRLELPLESEETVQQSVQVAELTTAERLAVQKRVMINSMKDVVLNVDDLELIIDALTGSNMFKTHCACIALQGSLHQFLSDQHEAYNPKNWHVKRKQNTRQLSRLAFALRDTIVTCGNRLASEDESAMEYHALAFDLLLKLFLLSSKNADLYEPDFIGCLQECFQRVLSVENENFLN
jgi:hypothetical protein